MPVSWHMSDLDARQVEHFDHSGVSVLALKSRVLLLEMAEHYVTRLQGQSCAIGYYQVFSVETTSASTN